MYQSYVVWHGKQEFIVMESTPVRAIQVAIMASDYFVPASEWNLSLLSDYSDKVQRKIAANARMV
jgi:hypothetical protein